MEPTETNSLETNGQGSKKNSAQHTDLSSSKTDPNADTNNELSPSLSERKKESYKIFDAIASRYDFLNRFLSCGIDIYWRYRMRKELPKKSNLEVLDLATGTADVALTLSSDARIKHIQGLDLSREMIKKGREKVVKKNLRGLITLDIGDGVKIPKDDQSFDVVTISFGIRNFSDPLASLKDIYRVLKPGGRLLITEFSLPKNKIIRSLYIFYFRHILPWIGNTLSRHPDAYSYLNNSVEDFPYGNDFLIMMKQAGFEKDQCIGLTFGIASLYVAEKPSDNQRRNDNIQ